MMIGPDEESLGGAPIAPAAGGAVGAILLILIIIVVVIIVFKRRRFVNYFFIFQSSLEMSMYHTVTNVYLNYTVIIPYSTVSNNNILSMQVESY